MKKLKIGLLPKILIAIALGVGIGLAVNGALSNLAGGVLLVITRPFKIDDFIEAEGYSGTVEAIHLVNTKIRTPDNKTVYIPNGPLSNGNIVNLSEKEIRRVDFSIPISYDEDFRKAKALLSELCDTHTLLLKYPEPMIRVSEYQESGICITMRVWVKNEDYWDVKYDLTEKVKLMLDENQIEIPYNRLDVHIR